MDYFLAYILGFILCIFSLALGIESAWFSGLVATTAFISPPLLVQHLRKREAAEQAAREERAAEWERAAQRSRKADQQRIEIAAQRNIQNDRDIRASMVTRVDLLIKENTESVLRAYRHTVSMSYLGVKSYNKFKKELLDFLERTITSEETAALNRLDVSFKSEFNGWLADELIRVFEGNNKAKIEENQIDFAGSPIEYEQFCAQLFRKSGWSAEVTKFSADQGVDIVVSKLGQRVAVQCKRFKEPVGNKAIQEVEAGRQHYRADFGVVVAPSGFTAAARQLASSCGVKLLHHDEIELLDFQKRR